MPVNKTFQIEARTVCLGPRANDQTDYLLRPAILFHIPIFQRPYSWEQTHVDKFISDLFGSFWGISGDQEPDSLFIGTMQLTDERHSDEYGRYFDVIDGQQRLTTFVLLIRVLQLRYPEVKAIQELPLDWIRSSVSNGAQQAQLDEFLCCRALEDFEGEKVNRFKINALIIADALANKIRPFDDRQVRFDVVDFADHLFTNVYFVVIQTSAKLSKTIQIFKAINTTGLDLGGEDIFKLRMFEYLKDRDASRHDNEIFLEISALYTTVEIKNKEYKWEALSIYRALGVYKYILIQRLKLPNVLYEMGTDTFFQNLFDAASRSAQPEHFNRIDEPNLSCGELRDIIDAMIRWEELDWPSAEDECVMNFIWNSRYFRFDLMRFLFIYKYRDDPAAGEKLFPFLKLLNKVYWVYSVIFQRRVYPMLTWTYSCLEKLMTGTYEETLELIRARLLEPDHYGRNVHDAVSQLLDGGITDNYRTKTLICRMSAMLDEDYRAHEDSIRQAIVTRLFGDSFDVEHIQSDKDSDRDNRPAITKEWEREINTIGNLVALEFNINRSIGNKKYLLKKPAYRNSKYASVALILEKYPEWDLTACAERRKSEKEKLMNYIFG